MLYQSYYTGGITGYKAELKVSDITMKREMPF